MPTASPSSWPRRPAGWRPHGHATSKHRQRRCWSSSAAHIAELRDDKPTAEITLAACEANLQALLSMIRHGIPADRTEAPAAALEHARHMAARGAGIDVTLRFYRLGHAWFTERWSTALVDKVRDPNRLLSAVRESIAVSFAYIDIVSAKVSAELVAERDRRQRRATAVRADTVGRLLAGDPVDADRLESTLGFALNRPLFAFLCWTSGDPATLEHAVAALAAKAGPGRPLILAEGTNELVGWAHLPGAREPSGRCAGQGRGRVCARCAHRDRQHQCRVGRLSPQPRRGRAGASSGAAHRVGPRLASRAFRTSRWWTSSRKISPPPKPW